MDGMGSRIGLALRPFRVDEILDNYIHDSCSPLCSLGMGFTINIIELSATTFSCPKIPLALRPDERRGIRKIQTAIN
jgi:hypothetical protein